MRAKGWIERRGRQQVAHVEIDNTAPGPIRGFSLWSSVEVICGITIGHYTEKDCDAICVVPGAEGTGVVVRPHAASYSNAVVDGSGYDIDGRTQVIGFRPGGWDVYGYYQAQVYFKAEGVSKTRRSTRAAASALAAGRKHYSVIPHFTIESAEGGAWPILTPWDRCEFDISWSGRPVPANFREQCQAFHEEDRRLTQSMAEAFKALAAGSWQPNGETALRKFAGLIDERAAKRKSHTEYCRSVWESQR